MGLLVKAFLGVIGIAVVVNLVFVDAKLVEIWRQQLPQRLSELQNQVNYLGLTRATVGSEREPEAVMASAEPVVVVTEPASLGMTKEVWLPLGSGSTSAADWVDTGAQAYVDTTIYPSLKEAYWQASLKSNSGTVYARLVQKNEGAVVPGSEINHSGSVSTLVTSGKILLSSGNKLYTVQLRSETGQEVFLENARVRLVLK